MWVQSGISGELAKRGQTFSFMLSRASEADGGPLLGMLMLFPAPCLALPGVHSVCTQAAELSAKCS